MFKTMALFLGALLAPSFMFGADPPANNGRIMVHKEGKYFVLTPEGKPISEFTSKPGRTVTFAGKERLIADKFVVLMPDGKPIEVPYPEKKTLTDPSFSPDGNYIAFIAPNYPVGHDRDLNYLRYLFIWELGKVQGFLLEIKAMNLAWTPEGKLLAVESESMKTMRDRKFTTWLIDVPTREKTKLEVPETAQIFAATPDGKSWIASTYDFAEKRLCHVSISRKDNSVSQFTQVGFGSMSPEQFIRLRLSPDGLRFLFLDIDRGEKLAAGMARFPRLYIFDLKTQKRERIADIPLDAFVWEYTWSPDSKKVAYIWKRMEPGVPLAASLDKNGKVKEDPKRDTETETHLNVADATGKNSRTILSAKGQSGPAITMSRLEWR